MPIRWNKKTGRQARIQATAADWTGSIAGTFSALQGINGHIQGIVSDFVGTMAGTFRAAVQFTGTIAQTLQSWSGSLTGVYLNRTPIWTGSGTLPSVSAASGTSVASYASDPEGDALTFDAVDTAEFSTDGSTWSTVSLASEGIAVSTAGAVTTSDVTPPGYYRFTVGVDDGHVANYQGDWLARSTAAGVLWAHNFSNSWEVDKFRFKGSNTGTGGAWTGGNCPSDVDGTVIHVPSGGPNGVGGAVRCVRAAVSTDTTNPGLVMDGLVHGACSSIWCRTLAPLPTDGILPADKGYTLFPSTPSFTPTQGVNEWTSWTHGFYAPVSARQIGYTYHGTEFWLSFKVRISGSRATATGSPSDTVAADYEKMWYITDKTGNQNEFNILCDTNHFGSWLHYSAFGSTYPDGTNGKLRDPQFADGTLSTTHFQNQSPYDLCVYPGYQTSGNTTCWFWPFDTWVTVLYHIKAGDTSTAGPTGSEWKGASNGTIEIGVWSPEMGRTDWLYLFKKFDWSFLWLEGEPNAFGSLLFSNYNQEARSESYYTEFSHIIFSSQPIACPVY